MHKYFCYIKTDSSKEPIYSLDAPNLYSAIQSFSQVKQLPPEQLLEIYNIERTKENT